jgi:hypothetical protein
VFKKLKNGGGYKYLKMLLQEQHTILRIMLQFWEGKRPLERRRRRWEDDFNMDLKDVGFGGMNWIYLAQDRDRWRVLVNAVMNLQVP